LVRLYYLLNASPVSVYSANTDVYFQTMELAYFIIMTIVHTRVCTCTCFERGGHRHTSL